MTYEIIKPEGTFYTDYDIVKGKCYAIFEHDVRVTTKFVCHTEKQQCDRLEETKDKLLITI